MRTLTNNMHTDCDNFSIPAGHLQNCRYSGSKIYISILVDKWGKPIIFMSLDIVPIFQHNFLTFWSAYYSQIMLA